MVARNEITGDLIKTTVNTEQYKQNFAKIFGGNKVQKGSYRQCRETGKFLPINEWLEIYGEEQKGQAPMVFCNTFEPFKSPVTDRVITNKRSHDYDLKSTGSRVYEGRESEQREVDRYRQRIDSKRESAIGETVRQTFHEIEHGYRQLKD